MNQSQIDSAKLLLDDYLKELDNLSTLYHDNKDYWKHKSNLDDKYEIVVGTVADDCVDMWHDIDNRISQYPSDFPDELFGELVVLEEEINGADFRGIMRIHPRLCEIKKQLGLE